MTSQSRAPKESRFLWLAVTIGTLAQLMLCFIVLGTNLTENMWHAYGFHQPRPRFLDSLLPIATGVFLALLAFPAGWMMHRESVSFPRSISTSIYRLIAVGWMSLTIGMLIAWIAITSSPLIVSMLEGRP